MPIDSKLKGLRWITPNYKDNVEEEINFIKDLKNQIQTDKRNKMVITHYSFISSILEENFLSPSMAYTSDGSIIPLKNNKYSQKYKNLVINLIKKNNVDVIYIVYPVHKDSIADYLDKSCLKEKLILNENKTKEALDSRDRARMRVPNLLDDDVPIGENDEGNKEISLHGPEINKTKARSHQEILDKITYADPAQLSELITIVLNANRYKSSKLGVRQNRTTKDTVSRNILD